MWFTCLQHQLFGVAERCDFLGRLVVFIGVAADTKKPVELVSNTGLFTLMCGYKYVTLNIGR